MVVRPTTSRLAVLIPLLLGVSAVSDPPVTAEEPPTGPSVSQAPVVLGTSHTFYSQVMDENRTLNVLLPPSYGSNESQHYPVVYLLDGAVREDYHHVAGLIQFLTVYQLMPESILVGIANTDRYRDFTHPTSVEEELKRVPNAGGSKKFTRYLSDEVKPYVDKTFRTAETDTLIGQSLGGLLAAEIFLKQPQLFDQYIIVSPSFWWADSSLIGNVEKHLQGDAKRSGALVVALGTEGPDMQKGVDQLIAALTHHAPEDLNWHYLPLPEETHATILHRAVYRSFEILYGESHPGL